MSITQNAHHAGGLVHPTALVSPEAVLAEDVVVGAYSIIEGRVRLGAGTILHARAHLIGPLTVGEGNDIYSNAIIGEKPQHFMYKDEPTSVEIGDNNVFRENVTIHRGTTGSWTTKQQMQNPSKYKDGRSRSEQPRILCDGLE